MSLYLKRPPKTEAGRLQGNHPALFLDFNGFGDDQS